MATAAASANLVKKVYAKAGIELRVEAVPFATAPPFGGTLPVVWTDDDFESSRWNARHPNPAKAQNAIIFDKLPLAHAWTARFFLWALCAADTVREHSFDVKRYAGAASNFTYFKSLVTFCESIGVHAIKDLRQENLEDFLLEFLSKTSKGNQRGEDSAKQMAIVLRRLYILGPAVSYWIPDGLIFDPEQVTRQLLNGADLALAQQREKLNEDIVRDLVSIAIDWVENRGPALFELREIDAAVDKWVTSIKPRKAKDHYHNFVAKNPHIFAKYKIILESFPRPLDAYLKFSFSKSMRRKPLGTKIVDQETFHSFKRVQAQYNGLYHTMMGMCYIVVGAFSGWRISEILSIEASYLRETVSGHELGSKVRKTAVDPNAVTHRPVPPIVARAVQLLIDLNSNLLTEKDKQLFRNSWGGPAGEGSVKASVGAACREATLDVNIVSHQWRHFFARFYLRRFKGNMDALRRHFRHVSREMIWAYAQDAANAAYLAQEESGLAREIAEGIIFGDGYRSRNFAQGLRAEYRALNLPPEAAEIWLSEQLSRLGLQRVYPTPWGYCLFQKGDVGAVCEAEVGPIVSRSEPGTCGGCKFFVTGDENIGFWQTTALVHKEIIDHRHHTPILKSASQMMLVLCQSILSRHKSTNVSLSKVGATGGK